MVKKLKTLAKNEDKQLASAVRTSAQQIWQAGLGAFAKAQEEGGRVFSKLVKEGTDLQKRTQKMAEDKVSDVAGTVNRVADGVSRQASGSWDKLEQVFEERVARALGSIGVPTQKDIQTLTKRVEQLSRAVAELSGKKVPAAKTTAAKKAAAEAVVEPVAKPAVKKAAAKPAAKASAVISAAKAEGMPVAVPKAKAAAKKAAASKPVNATPVAEADAASV